MFNRLVLLTFLLLLLLVIAPVASAQAPESTPDVIAEPTAAGTPVIQVTDSSEWTPQDYTLLAIGLIVPLATIISIVAVVYVKERSLSATIAALSASVEKLNTLETAVNAFPPQFVDILNTFGKALTFVPQLKDLGDLLQKVSDHAPNEPLPDPVPPSPSLRVYPGSPDSA